MNDKQWVIAFDNSAPVGLVGERGPEWVSFGGGVRIYPNPADSGQRVVDELRRWRRREGGV